MNSEVEEIKSRIDIVDLISQYVTLKKAGANYKGVCPFHQEKTPSMMVSPQKQIWKCFGCGKGGSVFDFVMESEHLEFGDALRLLAQKAGVTLEPRTQAEHQTHGRKERLFRINMLASRVYQKILLESPQGQSALDYLKKRGLKSTTIKEFGIGFAPRGLDLKKIMSKYQISVAELAQVGSPERFFERIMFPIFDVLGNVIAFTGRALGDAQPKYLNSPETPLFNKGRVLYGLNFAKAGIKQHDHVVLVEGQMDVIALHQAGVTQAVASSGTAITESQLSTLSKYTPNFMLAFDNDSAGQTTTRKVIEMLLRLDLNSKVVDFGTFKDAGEMLEQSSDAWPEMVKNATEGVEWIFNQEVKRVGDLQFIENKKKVISAMLPLLGLIVDETRLDHYVGRLALLTQSKPESLYASLSKNRPTSAPQAPIVAATHLTNEEQFLAILLYSPSLLSEYKSQFDEVVWQSNEAQRIAEAVMICYNKKTLVTNQGQFLTEVKNQLDAPLGDKVDSWIFWLTTTWPNFGEGLAKELASEKIAQLATKRYEQQKESLATRIRLAQEKGDLNQVKLLMKELNTVTKSGGVK